MGLNARFVPNPNLKQELAKAIAGAMNEVQNDLQAMFDRLGRQYKGQDVATIRPVLAREWTRTTRGSGTITEPDLTKYAKCISEGQRVIITQGQIR